MAPEEQLRKFKGVWIDRAVWLDQRLNALEKIILVEIDSLDNGEKGCFASNQYLADFCQCSERQVSRAISKLTDLGYLKSGGFNGRSRIVRSCLDKMSRLTGQNVQADRTKCPTINKENNKDINNKERKKEAETYDSIIDRWFITRDNPEVNSALYEFIKMRKLIKKPLTNRGLELLIEKLHKLSDGEPNKMLAILNQSIMNNWQGVFPLKDYEKPKAQNKSKDIDPEYLKELDSLTNK